MTTQMVIRIDPAMKSKVNELAKSEGKNISQVVRELIERYIQERDITGYIDDLWGRIEKTMESSGFTEDDINKTISDVRKETHESRD